MGSTHHTYNENLKQFPHEALYGTILKTIEIGPTANQTASTFAAKKKKKKKLSNNWNQNNQSQAENKIKTGQKKNPCYDQTRGQSIIINEKFDKRQIGHTIYWSI